MADSGDQCDRLPSKLPNLPQPAKTTLMDEQFLSQKKPHLLSFIPLVTQKTNKKHKVKYNSSK